MKKCEAVSGCSLLLALWVVVGSSTPPLLEAAMEAVELPFPVAFLGLKASPLTAVEKGPTPASPTAQSSSGKALLWVGLYLLLPHPTGREKSAMGIREPQREAACGRPLGIKFHPSTCELYIADAYYGLLAVGPQGGRAHQLASSAQGIPLCFTNALDIDPRNGVVYFTDSSILFQRRVWLLSIINGDKIGRLLKYDPRTRNVTVLLNGLAFQNGVALSTDSSFLLLAETGTFQILKFWLKGPKTHTVEIFVELERYPDNIKRTDNGEFWIAMNSARGKLEAQTWTGAVKGMVDGGEGQALESVSEVEESRGRVWIGSAVKPYIGLIING